MNPKYKTLFQIGIYPKSDWSHGQLYAAMNTVGQTE